MNTHSRNVPERGDVLSVAAYQALRESFERPGGNWGYNCHDLPSIAPFPERAHFRLSEARLDDATQVGDTMIDRVFLAHGGEAAIDAVRRDSLHPPAWIDLSRVRRGQRVGRRYFSLLAMALGNLSLIGGFGASKINRVLVRGSRLSRSSGSRGYDPIPRLVETAAWLLEVLKDIDVGSSGFEETAKVRALHSMIRAHLHERHWDSDRFDAPINQEQMLSTLMGFSYNGVWGLQRMGIRLRAQEVEDYIHLWSYIGYLLGIEDDLLPRSFDEARATTLQLIPRILDPDDETRAIIRNLHERRQDRLGLPRPVQAAMCRFFLPHPYAEALGIHGNPAVDVGVGWLYRALGATVATVGQLRPDALERWEIERVSRRLETALAAMRHGDTDANSPPASSPPIRQSLRAMAQALLTL